MTTLLETIIIEPTAKAEHSVIWLHGLGADGHDFEPIVSALHLPANLAVRFVFPHAPLRAVTINNGEKMRAWYDLAQTDFQFKEDEQGIIESSQLIEQLIVNEQEKGIASQNIVLAGFSQGGAMALHCGINYSQPLAGIMVLSGYLPIAEKFATNTFNKTLPIMLAHGIYDMIVKYQWGIQTKNILVEQGYNVDWYEYPMEHQLCQQEIDDIAAWLKRILN